MRSVRIREAKATFSALVEAASRGEPVLITRHGEPVAALVPVEDAAKLYPEPKMTLVEYLLTMPEGDLDLTREPAPAREIEL
jgi:prevent-host-death family protein